MNGFKNSIRSVMMLCADKNLTSDGDCSNVLLRIGDDAPKTVPASEFEQDDNVKVYTLAKFLEIYANNNLSKKVI